MSTGKPRTKPNTGDTCPECGGVGPGEGALCSQCREGEVEREALTTADDGVRSEPISAGDKTAAELKRALSPRIELLRRLMSGGMSVVYLGKDPALRRLVAIKVLSDDLANDAMARARFTREAEAAAAIDHPNVIDIYEVGTLPRSNKPYIVMQFVDGLTLQQELLVSSPLPEMMARGVVGEIASALAAAHARGVVHRDIKPSNVVLDRETGHAVVLDFGISAALQGGSLAGAEKLTLTGVSVGTPSYMSPEQAAAKEVNDRSDVYSLGVVAFEMVTGRLPFLANAPEGYLAAHLQDTPPDISTLRADLDDRFAEIIDRCLSKHADRRPSAEGIARALLPPTRFAIEWPPPGLGVLKGAGWSLLNAMATSLVGALAFFAMLLIARPAGGAVQIPLGTIVTLTAVLAGIVLVRASRLTFHLRWARGLGYPWPVLIDVALDHRPDTAALINGTGPYAFLSGGQRDRLRAFRRVRAGLVLTAVAAAILGFAVWAWGAGSPRGAGPTGVLSSSDSWFLLFPPAALLLASFLMAVPGWLALNRARYHRLRFPFRWTPQPVRSALVSRWLSGAGQEPSPASERIPVWFKSTLGIGVFTLPAVALLTMLGLSLTVLRAVARWSTAGEPTIETLVDVAVDRPPWRDMVEAVNTSSQHRNASGRANVNVARDLVAWVGAWPDSATADMTFAVNVWWRNLPAALSPAARDELAADSSLMEGVELWRELARSVSLRPLWMYPEALGASDESTEPSRVPLAAMVALARENEAAALLAAARGATDTAELRARENIAVGRQFLRDPINGPIAVYVVELGRGMLAEVGLLSGDRDLLLEAEQLREVVARIATPLSADVGAAARLMIDPAEPAGLSVIGNDTHAPYVRWWTLAGIVPGFCGNAREILLGVDPRRRETLVRAAALADDIPRTDEWVEVLDRQLEQWITSPGTARRASGASAPATLWTLRLVGLGGIADRVGYCREAARQLGS